MTGLVSLQLVVTFTGFDGCGINYSRTVAESLGYSSLKSYRGTDDILCIPPDNH